eukprot:244450-Rhodomonas_salina.2
MRSHPALELVFNTSSATGSAPHTLSVQGIANAARVRRKSVPCVSDRRQWAGSGAALAYISTGHRIPQSRSVPKVSNIVVQ